MKKNSRYPGDSNSLQGLNHPSQNIPTSPGVFSLASSKSAKEIKVGNKISYGTCKICHSDLYCAGKLPNGRIILYCKICGWRGC